MFINAINFKMQRQYEVMDGCWYMKCRSKAIKRKRIQFGDTGMV